MLRVTMKLIKAWLNYQRAKIRRRHDEKVSKRIRLEDAMAVCAAAADASRKAEGCTETKEDAGVAEPKSGL